MKRVYTKPRICKESFGLTQNIAQNCAFGSEGNEWGKPLSGDPMNCAWEDIFGGKVFVVENHSCLEENTGAFCYNAPVGAIAVFGS